MTARDIIWTDPHGAGLEHLHLSSEDEGFLADLMFVGRNDDLPPFRLHVVLRLSADWRMDAVTVRLLSDAEGPRELSFTVNGGVDWRDAEGRAISELNGCYEIDLATSAFTKALPIRRLQLADGESAEISVAYVDAPLMRIRPVRQRYTCIEPLAPDGGVYRYEPLFRGNAHELRVDSDGLVTDYPGAFRRVFAD